MTALMIIGFVILAVFGYHVYSFNKLQAKYGAALAEYNAGAFKEITEPANEEEVYVTKLGTEVESKSGIKAVLMPVPVRGTALHQINKNGTFSTKGPYFVSWQSNNWRITGRTHLIKVVRGKHGGSYKADHYNQDGTINEVGIAILEYNTTRYRPTNVWDFARNFKAQQGAPADPPGHG